MNDLLKALVGTLIFIIILIVTIMVAAMLGKLRFLQIIGF